MTPWITGRDGRDRQGAHGRARDTTDPLGDYIGGELALTQVGDLTPESPGYSGWSTDDYLVGQIAPAGTEAAVITDGVGYTLGIHTTLPSTNGAAQHLVGRGATYGLRVWLDPSSFILRIFLENASGTTIVSRSIALSAYAPGDDVWVFVMFDRRFEHPVTGSGTTGLAIVEVGALTATETAGAHAADCNTTEDLHRLGVDNALGGPWTTPILEVLGWASRLVEAEQVDVANGDDLHDLVLGYFR